jgi:hypothetical protein
MSESSENTTTPGWVEGIFDYVKSKPYTYVGLIEGFFVIASNNENQRDGYGSRLDHIFFDSIVPEKRELNLKRFKILKEIVNRNQLDLMEVVHEGTLVGLYRGKTHLRRLAIGRFGLRPISQDIDKLFSVYEDLEERLEKVK